MPVTVQGNNRNASKGNIDAAKRANFNYDYPYNLDLHPRSKLHKKLVDKILELARVANEEKNKRKDEWDKTDDTLSAYIPLSVAEQKLKTKDVTKPTAIVVPYSYATLETLLTYLMMAFVMQRPMFQYESVSTEDTIAVKLLEVLVQRQVEHLKVPLSTYAWWRDGLGYGIGAVAPIWTTERRQVTETREVEKQTLTGNTIIENETVRESRIVFEGSKVKNIGPRYLLLDPNVSAHNIQSGEFVGWIEETNQQQLLKKEQTPKTPWINAKYVHTAGPVASQYTVTDNFYKSTDGLKPLTILHMYVDLLPREWDLPGAEGNEDGYYPETWLFSVADDWCIVSIDRDDSSHGKKPFAINAPDYDGYSTYPLSRIEIINGLQDVLNWLFNSHIANVRKVVNNQLIVDPSQVRVEDLKKGREGGIIRLKSSAWGKDVRTAVSQLQVTDVTRGHIADADAVISMMQRVGAATDNIMGIPRQGGERHSATEARAVATSATNRLEKIASLISWQGMQDLSMFMAMNTQDYMEMELKRKVLGNWPTELIQEYQIGNDVQINPDIINVPFDISLRDGSLPVDTSGVAESWIQLLQTGMSVPQIGQTLDFPRVFLHIARLLGAKNVNDFMIQPGVQTQILPDETAMRELEKGNIVKPQDAADAKNR
jgi:hypothetical protein